MKSVAPRLILALFLSLALPVSAAQAQVPGILPLQDDTNKSTRRYEAPQLPTIQEAMDAFQVGDMQTALNDFDRLAPQGDATAQFYLGYMLDKGLTGSSPNPFAAAGWYRKSAQQDYLPAVTYMGYIFSVGHGVSKDDKEAFKWYTRAARMGSADAQNAVGEMLREGRGYDRNYNLAAEWFLQAATQNNARAQSNLASMYFLGHGVKANVPTAIYWYNLAAKQKDVTALTALGAIYRNGVDGVDKDPAKAVQYYALAAEQGHLPAELALAQMYEAGEGDKTKDASDAAVLYARAAKQGSLEAETRLGYYSENGVGLPQDIPAAVKWYKEASDNNYLPARLALARLYETGKGPALPADIKQSVTLYKSCAMAGDPRAEMKLGEFYSSGKAGLPQDFVSAYEWYALAADTFPEGEDKHTAIKNRIEMANALTQAQIGEARSFLSTWKPVPLVNQFHY